MYRLKKKKNSGNMLTYQLINFDINHVIRS